MTSLPSKKGKATELCPCGSQQVYAQCCERFICGSKLAPTPEALMRSRYSAYAKGAYPYILATYATPPRLSLSASSLAEHDKATHWRRLELVQAQDNEVEFKAYYQVQGQYYLMHEVSEFVQENGEWRYSDGHIQPDSGKLILGRNSSCACGSGQKFKRCCA